MTSPLTSPVDAPRRAIVISFDRLPLGYLGCYGNDWIETPHLDRLATQSVLFDLHFGENFDPQKVETLAAQSAEKTSEIIKTQAFIESQFRQILTPDQFYVFRFLIGELVMPQRRMNPQQILRQQQQRRLGGQPNGPIRPPNQQQPENKN